jgi:carboxypeptidase C (cathepsin A)
MQPVPILAALAALASAPTEDAAQTAAAAQSAAAAQPAAAAQTPAAAPVEPKVFTSHHEGTFHGTHVAFTATAGETILDDEDGKPAAAVFSIAYVKEGVEDPATRPVTFLWNGGPGSSSVWLHMGAFGPWRVDVPSDARDDGGPPYRVVENPGAFLDVSDVVFVDPVGTGFSRPLGEKTKEEQAKAFFGVRQDARWMARFIRRWVSANDRWSSQRFVGGESYGTTRSAAVVKELEGGIDDLALNGVILISTILDFSIVEPAVGNELPYLIDLPTMAATAHYHGKAGRGVPLADFVEEARRFARTEYAEALMLGDRLGGDQRARVRAELARLTGLSEEYVERCDLRVRPDRFQKELLRDRGLTVGRLDSRYTGQDLDDAGETPEADPSFYGVDGAFASALNAMLRDRLGVRLDRDYVIMGGLWSSWDWSLQDGGGGFYTNLAPYLGTALRQNADLAVFVAAGYYDFATPFYGAEYSLARSGVPPERVRFEYYEAGHMMYVNHEALAKLQDDVHGFLQNAAGRAH